MVASLQVPWAALAALDDFHTPLGGLWASRWTGNESRIVGTNPPAVEGFPKKIAIEESYEPKNFGVFFVFSCGFSGFSHLRLEFFLVGAKLETANYYIFP